MTPIGSRGRATHGAAGRRLRRSQDGGDGGGDGGGGDGDYVPAGYSWDKTFTDYSWLTDADANGTLNVEKVTNLNASGTGSFRDAVMNASSYPTVVVFEVGGVIDLGGSEQNYAPGTGGVWVAGETAPDPGISFIRSISFFNSSNMILSHLGFYGGDDGMAKADDAVGTTSDSSNQIFDHCTAMWGTDECMSASAVVNGNSYINNLVGEGLYNSIHPENQHSRAMLFNSASDDVTVAGNLFFHVTRRCPLNRTNCFMVNNHMYNWVGRCVHHDNSDPVYTAIGLYSEDGDETHTTKAIFGSSAEIYIDDIHIDGADHPIQDGTITELSSPPVVPPNVTISEDVMPGSEVRSWTRAQSGMRPASRPQVDADLINNRLQSGNGRIDSQTEVGGYPDYAPTSRTLSVPDTGIVDWIKTNHTAVVEGTA